MRFKQFVSGLVSLSMISLLISGCNTGSAEDAFQGYSGPVGVGAVEGTEVDVNSKLPGKVARLLVEEGEMVKAGQTIAELTSEEIKAKETQAKALVTAAKSQWDQAEAAVKLQQEISDSNLKRSQGALTAAQAQLDKARKGARDQEIAQAQAAYNLMNATFQRVQKLYQTGAIPAQKYDEVKTQLEVARQNLSIAKEGARSEDVRSAEAMVAQAQAGVDAAMAGQIQVELAKQSALGAKAKYDQALGGLTEVRTYLKECQLKAPTSGVITALYTDAGEMVSTGMPIATVTDMEQLWVEVKVKESDLAQVRNRDKVVVVLANQAHRSFTGKVVRISKKPDFATKRSTGERGEQDVFAYGVKIRLEGQIEAAPGVTAKVKFLQSHT